MRICPGLYNSGQMLTLQQFFGRVYETTKNYKIDYKP